MPETLSPGAPVDGTPDTNEITQLFSVKFPDHQLSFDEFVAVDETLQCCEENLNDYDFIACVNGNEEICDSDDGEEIIQAFEKKPLMQSLPCINILKDNLILKISFKI